MKKLIVAAALVLGSVSIYATSLQKVNTNVNRYAVLQDYTEIAVSDLPSAVTETVAADYPNAMISKAYVLGKEYKLILDVDGAMQTVYITDTGKWIDK